MRGRAATNRLALGPHGGPVVNLAHRVIAMGYWWSVIVACTSCPAQYSVPDAKIRGRKVRITCKHCGNSFVVDATDQPIQQLMRLDALPALAGSDASDDATRVMSKPRDVSVHDEQTVIGQIPAAALEAERRFAQRTLPPPPPAPPPPAPSVSTTPSRALPADVAEHPRDVTDIASPQAKRSSQASLPPSPAELKTLASASVIELPAARSRRTLYWLVALAVGLLVLLLLIARSTSAEP